MKGLANALKEFKATKVNALIVENTPSVDSRYMRYVGFKLVDNKWVIDKKDIDRAIRKASGKQKVVDYAAHYKNENIPQRIANARR